MRSLIERFRSSRSHAPGLVVEAESSVSLAVRSGRMLTVLDRLSRAVTQNGRQIATLGSIHHVRVDERATEGGPAWQVALQLAGSRLVAIGRTKGGSEASVAAQRIAAITGTRVVTKRLE